MTPAATKARMGRKPMYCGELGRNWLSVRCFHIKTMPSARLGNPRNTGPINGSACTTATRSKIFAEA